MRSGNEKMMAPPNARARPIQNFRVWLEAAGPDETRDPWAEGRQRAAAGAAPQVPSGATVCESGKRPAYFSIHSEAASWVLSFLPSCSSTSFR